MKNKFIFTSNKNEFLMKYSEQIKYERVYDYVSYCLKNDITLECDYVEWIIGGMEVSEDCRNALRLLEKNTFEYKEWEEKSKGMDAYTMVHSHPELLVGPQIDIFGIKKHYKNLEVQRKLS